MPGPEEDEGEKERGGMVVINGEVILALPFIGPLLGAPHCALFGTCFVSLNIHITMSLRVTETETESQKV